MPSNQFDHRGSIGYRRGMKPLFVVVVVVVSLVFAARTVRADERGAVADSIAALGTSAETLGKNAKSSDDRGVRKRFAGKATELADDLAALARRTRKDVPLTTIATELAELDKQATALIDAADDADDKAERKQLRATATSLEQGIVAAKKTVDALAAAKPAAAKVVA